LRRAKRVAGGCGEGQKIQRSNASRLHTADWEAVAASALRSKRAVDLETKPEGEPQDA
jgi:hypothetical protein